MIPRESTEGGARRAHAARVLVAEDDPAGRELMAALLERLGYGAVVVGDAESALAIVREDPPDLVLSDVGMPGMGGFELCRRLKADSAARLIPVVLVTGIGEEYRRAGIEAGADEFLGKPVMLDELRLRLKALLRMKAFTNDLESAEAVLCTLGKSIEAKDRCTVGHCERLAAYAVALGKSLGLGAEDLAALRLGGYLHDVGKVAVPDAILLKSDDLTAEERRTMQRHPVVGEEICRPLRTLRSVLPVIRHHHERQDGSGYPDGLAGEAVPLLARILQIVDVYDAMTTDRPYRRAMTGEAAQQLLRVEAERGWWDPAIAARFRDLMVSGESAGGREDSHVGA